MSTDQGLPSVINELHGQLQEILRGLSDSLDADVATLWLYDADSDEFGLPISHGVQRPHPSIDPILRPGTHHGGEIIVDTKKPIIANDITNTIMDGPFAYHEGIKSSAGFPLLYDNQAVGVLFVSHRRPHAFTEEEKRVIGKTAEQTASIIAKTDIFTALRRLYPEQDQTLKAVTDLAFRIMRKPVAIWLFESQQRVLHIKASTGVTQEYFENASVQLGDGSIISQVMETGEKRIDIALLYRLWNFFNISLEITKITFLTIKYVL